MLARRIIPCLDVKDGRVVKGINFIALRDAGGPVENAKIYEEQGADELVFLDITASWEHRRIIREVVEKTAGQVFMPLTVIFHYQEYSIPQVKEYLKKRGVNVRI